MCTAQTGGCSADGRFDAEIPRLSFGMLIGRRGDFSPMSLLALLGPRCKAFCAAQMVEKRSHKKAEL